MNRTPATKKPDAAPGGVPPYPLARPTFGDIAGGVALFAILIAAFWIAGGAQF